MGKFVVRKNPSRWINCRLPEKLYTKLEGFCEKHGLTKQRVVSQLVEEGINRNEEYRKEKFHPPWRFLSVRVNQSVFDQIEKYSEKKKISKARIITAIVEKAFEVGIELN